MLPRPIFDGQGYYGLPLKIKVLFDYDMKHIIWYSSIIVIHLQKIITIIYLLHEILKKIAKFCVNNIKEESKWTDENNKIYFLLVVTFELCHFIIKYFSFKFVQVSKLILIYISASLLRDRLFETYLKPSH